MAYDSSRLARARVRTTLLGSVSALAVTLVAPAAGGQSATSSIVSGSVHTTVSQPDATSQIVTTSNVDKAGQVAFNRFDKFEVARDNLVTLVLPTDTRSLVNVVPSAVRIDGTLNSRLVDATGAIGGDLFFLTTGGMFVGASGVINTGRLIVRGGNAKGNLPSTDAQYGKTDAYDVAALLDYAPTRVVTIEGRINAPGGVDLSADRVTVGAGGSIATGKAGIEGLAPQQAAAVSMNGIAEGKALVKLNGGIAILGTELVRVEAAAGAGAPAAILDARPYFGPESTGKATLAGAIDIASSGLITVGGVVTAWDRAPDFADLLSADVTITASRRVNVDDEFLSDVTSNYFADIAAETGVTVDGAVSGRTVTIGSSAGSITRSDPEIALLNANPQRASVQFLMDYAQTRGLLGVAGLDAFFTRADAQSAVRVGDGATIDAVRDLSLKASSEAIAQGFSATRANGAGAVPGVALSVGVALLDSSATVSTGGALTAGRTLTIEAGNLASSNLSLSAVSIDKAVSAGVAYSDIKVDAAVDVRGTLDAANVAITATNGQALATQGFVNSASVIAKDGSPAGGSAAVLNVNVDSTVDVTATIGGKIAPRTVRIGAANTTNSVRNHSAADVDSGLLTQLFALRTVASGSIDGLVADLGGLVADKIIAKVRGVTPASVDQAKKTAHVGAAVAVLDNQQSATATVTGTITAAGQVAVSSLQRDITVRNTAKAAVAASRETDGDAATAAGALAFGTTDYVSTATVGGTVTSPALAVSATTQRQLGKLVEVPLSVEDGSASAVALNFASDKLGFQRYGATPDKGLFGSAAGATAATDSAKQAAISGSVAYADIAADTRAWINPDARIATQALDVHAKSDLTLLSLSGAIPIGTAGVGATGGAATGLAVVYTLITPTTVAGIGKGVVIVGSDPGRPGVRVDVDAATSLSALTLAPQAGASNGATGSGSFAMNEVDGRTQATISKDARIDLAAGSLKLDALTDMQVTAVGGSLAITNADGTGGQSTAGSIGVTGALNLVDFDTRTLVGDAAGDDTGDGAAAAGAGITAGAITLGANATGMINALSIAGSVTGTGPPSMKPGKIESAKTKLALAKDQFVGGLTGLFKDVSESAHTATDGKVSEARAQRELKALKGAAAKNSFGVAGSASVNLSELATQVETIGATFRRSPAEFATDATFAVRAAEGVDLLAVSGGAALAVGEAVDGENVMIGGAYGLSYTKNLVASDVTGSTIDGFGKTDIAAAANGLRIGSALALAVDASKSEEGAAAAASVSHLVARDGARATVTDSTITGAGSAIGGVSVTAYNGMTMGAGAGGLAASNTSAVGGAVTVIDIGSPDGGAADARVVRTPVTNAGALTVRALTAARIAGVAVAGGVSNDAASTKAVVTGAVAVNLVSLDTSALIDTGADGKGVVAVGGAVRVDAGDLGDGDQNALSNAGRSGDTAGTSMLDEFKLGAGTFGSDDPVKSDDLRGGTQVLAIALPVSVSTSKGQAAGLGIAWNQIDNDRTASIIGGARSVGGATISAGSLAVDAVEHTDILSLGVGVGVSAKGFGIMGSIATNIVTGSSFAGIGRSAGASDNLTIDIGGAVAADSPNLAVIASGDGGIFGLAGGLALGKDSAIGFAIGVNRITRTSDAGDGGMDTDGGPAGVHAAIDGVTLRGTSDTDVLASARGRIIANAIGVAGSTSQAGIAGAASSNEIAPTIDASVRRLSYAAATPGDLMIRAEDRSSILSTGLVVGIGNQGGVAAGVAVNRIDADVTARLTVAKDESIRTRNLLIDSVANSASAAFGLGVGGGQSLGGAGSVAINLMNSDVTSRLTQTGGDVSATGSIGVVAKRDTIVDVAGGAIGVALAGAGVGAAAVVNVLGGSATAEIVGSGEGKIAATGDFASDDTIVLQGLRTGALNDGALPRYSALGDFASQSLGDGGIAIDLETTGYRGVAVNASSTAVMRTVAIAGGVAISGAAVGITGVVNNVTGTTRAAVANANVTVGGGTARDDLALDVRASSQTVGLTFAGAGSGSGDVAASAPLATDGFGGSTSASITGGELRSAGGIAVNAIGNQASTALVIAGAGSGAVAASIGSVSPRFAQTVSATLDRPDKILALGTAGVAVGATSSATSFATFDAIAGSLYAAGAGAIVVATNENATAASYVGKRDGDKESPVEVEAAKVAITADGTFDSTLVAASVAAAAGGALVGNGLGVVHRGTVSALADGLSYEAREGMVDVTARERVSIVPVVGQVAVGGGSASLGVIAVLSQSKVDATLSAPAIDARAVRVAATGYNRIDAAQAGLTGGSTFGVGVNVTYIGVGAVTDTGALLASTSGDSSDNAVAEAVGSNGSRNANLDQLANGGSASNAQVAAQAGNRLNSTEKATAAGDTAARRSFSNIAAPGEEAAARVRAQVLGTDDAGSLRASDTLSITSGAHLLSKSTNAQLAGGGTGGVVGTVAITRNAALSSAYLGDVAARGGTLTIAATTGEDRAPDLDETILSPTAAAEAQIYAGAAGGTGALAVGVADVRLQSVALAEAQDDIQFDAATIVARDLTNARSSVFGVALGGVALNLVVSQATKDGTVQSRFGGRANGDGDASLSILADARGGADARAVAGAGGGLFGGNAAAANATDNRIVRAIVSEGTILGVDALVRATSTPLVSARAFGVAVALGLAAGASVANATAGGNVSALVGENGIASRSLDVVAFVERPIDDDSGERGDNVTAIASGSAGGLYVAVNGASAIARSDLTIAAVLGADLNGAASATGFMANQRLRVAATRDLAQHADATGITAAGLLAVGVQRAEATSRGTTRAALENVDGSAGGGADATVAADAIDRNVATVTSGAGGTTAGLAALAVTDTGGAVLTELTPKAGTTFTAGTLTATARSVADYRADSDSLLATAVGASGTTSRNIVSTSATTNVGGENGGETNARFEAGTFRISASNVVGIEERDGGTAKGAGGGLIAAAATIADNDLDQRATVNIRDNVVLRQYGGDATQNTRATFIDAAISTNRSHAVALSIGGGLQAPSATVESVYGAVNTVTIGAGVLIRGDQGVGIGTNVQQNVADSAAVQVYGLSGDGGGTSTSTSNVAQRVTIGDSARIESLMDVRLSAGTSADGSTTDLLRVASQADTFNWTAVPATSQADTDASVTSDSRLSLGRATIRSGRDLILEATKSATRVSASGTGHNPYLELVSQTNQSGETSETLGGLLTIGGSMLVAGFLGNRQITIAADGTITRVDVGDEALAGDPDRLGQYDVSQGLFSSRTYIDGQLDDLIAQAQSLGLAVPPDPIGAADEQSARNELNLAASKSALIAQIAGLYETRGALAATGDNAARPAVAIGGVLVDSQLIGNGIFAAGGTVALNGAQIVGVGDVTANGGGVVTIVNQTDRNTIVGNVFVPMKPAGTVTLGGAATVLPGSIRVIRPISGDVAAGAVSVTTGAARSDIIVLGHVQNVGGAFSARTTQGNYVQFGEVNAASFSADAPNGLFSVSAGGGNYSQGEPLAFYYGNYGVSLFPNAGGRGSSQDAFATGVGGRIPFTAQDAAVLLANYFATVRVGKAGQAGGYQSLLDGYRATFGTTSNDVLHDLYISNAARSSADGRAIGDALFLKDGDGVLRRRNSTIWSGCLQTCEFFSTNQDLGGGIQGVRGSLGFDGDNDAIFSGTDFYTTPGLTYRTPVTVSNPPAAGTSLPIAYPATERSAITANQVIVTAKNIDVSGTITAGPTKQRTLTIANTVEQTTRYRNETAVTQRDFGEAIANSDDAVVDLLQRVRVSVGITLDTTFGTAASGNVGARFVKTQADPLNDRAVGYIQVDDILAGTGGSISLNGRILNTNPLGGGKLKVLNGFGNITVDNQTPYEIRLGTINAGLSVDGRITLRDQGVTTEYVNSVGGQVRQTVTRAGGTSTVTDYLAGEGLSDAAALRYTPTGRVYYVWNDSRQLARSVSPLDARDPRLDLQTVSPWRFLKGGQAPQGGDFVDIDDRTGSDPGAAIRLALGTGTERFVQIASGTVQNRYQLNYAFSDPKYNYRVEIPTLATINVKTATSATNPIAIVFDQGRTTGGIAVTSNNGGAITLTDALTFGGGTVALASNAALSQRDGGIVVAKSLDLRAGSGGIGALIGSDQALRAGAFRASLVGGTVDAVATGGSIALDLQAIGVSQGTPQPIVIGAVSAPAGSVAITVDAGIAGLDRGNGVANVTARDAITLVAGGAVGSEATIADARGAPDKPMLLTARALRVDLNTGVLNVTAGSNVAIEQVGLGNRKTLRIGSIATPGDVLLRVPGSVVAADATATVDQAKLARFVTATRLLDLAPVCTMACGDLPTSALDTTMRAEGFAAWDQLSADAGARDRLTALFGYVPETREAIATLTIARERKIDYQARVEARSAFDLYLVTNAAAYAEQQRGTAIDAALVALDGVAGLRRETAIGLSDDGRSVSVLDRAATTVRPGGALYRLAEQTFADNGIASGPMALSPGKVAEGLQLYLDALVAPVDALLPGTLPDIAGLDAAAARIRVGGAIDSPALAAWAGDRTLVAQRAKATSAAVGQIDALQRFARTSDAIALSADGATVRIVNGGDPALVKGGFLYEIAAATLRNEGRAAGDVVAIDVARGLQLYVDQLHDPLDGLIAGALPTLDGVDAALRYDIVSAAIDAEGLARWVDAQRVRSSETLTALFGTPPPDRAAIDTAALDPATIAARNVGATWLQTMLDVAVPTSAFVPVADTQFQTRAPVITARGVSIVAGNSIGAFDEPRTFAYTAAGFTGAAADRDLAAAYLASAGPGDVTSTVTRDAQGKVTDLSFTTRRDQPLTIAATGIVNAIAGTNPTTFKPSTATFFSPVFGNVFLTNTKPLSVGTIVSQTIGDGSPPVGCITGSILAANCDGRIRLVAPTVSGVARDAARLGSLSNDERGLVMGGLVRIEASTGSITGGERDGTLSVDARALEVLRAADTIRIVRRQARPIATAAGELSFGNDLTLGDVYAGGRFQIDNPFGSLSVVRLPSPLDSENRNSRLVVGALAMRAAGDIGSAETTATGIGGAFDVEAPWIERFVAGFDFAAGRVGSGAAPGGIAAGNGYLALRGDTRLGGAGDGSVDPDERGTPIGARGNLTVSARGVAGGLVDLRSNIRVGGAATVSAARFRLGDERLVVAAPGVSTDGALLNLAALRLNVGRISLLTDRSIAIADLRSGGGTVESRGGRVTVSRFAAGTGSIASPLIIKGRDGVSVADIAGGNVSLVSATGDVRVTGAAKGGDLVLLGRDVAIGRADARNLDLLSAAGGTVTITGEVAASGRLAAEAGSIIATDRAAFRRIGALSLVATGDIRLDRGVSFEDVATARLTAGGPGSMALGRFGGGSLFVETAGALALGRIEASDAITLRSAGETALNDGITAAGTLDIAAGTIRFARGDVLGELGGLTLSADSLLGPAPSVRASGRVALTIRDSLTLESISAASATVSSTAGSIRFDGPVRISDAGNPASGTLAANAADTITVAAAMSASGGITLTAPTVETTGSGYLTDLDRPGALTALRADTIDVRFATGAAAGGALRLDVRGLNGLAARMATVHFDTMRPLSFDAFHADRGWIDAVTGISIANLAMRDHLLIGGERANVLLSADGSGPAATRTRTTGSLIGASLVATPRADDAPEVVLTRAPR